MTKPDIMMRAFATWNDELKQKAKPKWKNITPEHKKQIDKWINSGMKEDVITLEAVDLDKENQ